MKNKSLVFKISVVIGTADFLFWSWFNYIFFHTVRSHWMETIQVPYVVLHLPVFLLTAWWWVDLGRLIGVEASGYVFDFLGGLETFAGIFLVGKMGLWILGKETDEAKTF